MNSSLIEDWKYIPGFEGLYLISNWGRVMALDYKRRGECKILELTCTRSRYIKVGLRDRRGKYHTCWLHRLVALAFIPNPQGAPEVDHWDGCRLNNCSCNLRWVDSKTNSSNPNSAKNRRTRYHRPGEWTRRSEGQKNRFRRPEEREKLRKAREKRWKKRREEIPPTENNRENT